MENTHSQDGVGASTRNPSNATPNNQPPLWSPPQDTSPATSQDSTNTSVPNEPGIPFDEFDELLAVLNEIQRLTSEECAKIYASYDIIIQYMEIQQGLEQEKRNLDMMVEDSLRDHHTDVDQLVYWSRFLPDGPPPVIGAPLRNTFGNRHPRADSALEQQPPDLAASLEARFTEQFDRQRETVWNFGRNAMPQIIEQYAQLTRRMQSVEMRLAMEQANIAQAEEKIKELRDEHEDIHRLLRVTV